jgi:hypothetical protein
MLNERNVLRSSIMTFCSAMTNSSGEILSKSTGRENKQRSERAFKEHCLALGEAVSSHSVGDTTAKVQQLIMPY